MKFVCDRCQTKYSIPDERVRGKVLKVKCKTCTNLITVREARSPSAAGLPPISGSTRPKTGAHPPIDTSVETEERTQLARFPPEPEADPFPSLTAPAPKRRPTGQIAPLGAVDDHVQWYMALDGERTGPFARQKLIDKLMPLAKHADVHIWNERLGVWKSPGDVPEIASEISRRRAPPPPPLPGAPRRPTPPPIPPLAGLSHGQPRRPTPFTPPSPADHGAGVKLPPPGGVHPALAARGASHADPTSLLETPAPQPHAFPHSPNGQKTNGVGAAGAHAPPRPVNSDVLQMLNMPGAAQAAPGGPPRLMSLTAAMGMGVPMEAPPARSRSAVYILGLLAVIGLVVVLVMVGLKKPPRPTAVIAKPPVTAPPEPVVEKPVVPEPPPAPVIEATPPPPAKKGRGGKATRAVATKGAPAATPAVAAGGDAARFRDTSHPNLPVNTGGSAARPPPAQADITRVISNNRAGIKVCYQRALTRDNSLTHGKLAVKLSIGISGRVKHVGLDGPAQFKLLLEPCIKEVVARWVFPQASEEYGTEFPLVFQGNE
jgi:predicted Zn finger-like uncharacterized protein